MVVYIKILCIFVTALAVCMATSALAINSKVAVNLKSSQMKIKYVPNQVLGNHEIKFIKEVLSHVKPNGRKERKALFLCHCGNEWESMIQTVKSNTAKSCGCEQHPKGKNNIRWNGNPNHPLNSKYQAIKQRCYNPNCLSFKDYGARGIVVSDEFLNDFKVFAKYVENLPNAYEKNLTIDRINNNGNYERGNLRWTSRHIQATNQRINKLNTSGFTGIWYDKSRQKWSAEIKVHNIKYYLGRYINKEESVLARKNFIIKNNLTEYTTGQQHKQ